MAKSFQFGRRVGSPRQVGNIEIIPESLVLLVHGDNWGYVWNWPIAVSVARRNGPGDPQVERHAIVDVTRLLLWFLWGTTALMLLAALFGPFFLRARKRKSL
jgi:hypothetical protein